MIRCEETRDLLPVYVGGGLDEGSRRDIAAHLAVCAVCRKETALLFTLKLAQKSLAPQLPENVRLEAFRLVRAERTKTGSVDEVHLFDDLFGAISVARSALRLTYRLIKI